MQCRNWRELLLTLRVQCNDVIRKAIPASSYVADGNEKRLAIVLAKQTIG